jgi:hypothetical protein
LISSCLLLLGRFFVPFQNHDITFQHSTKGQTFARFRRENAARVRAAKLESIDVASLAVPGNDRNFRRTFGATGARP